MEADLTAVIPVLDEQETVQPLAKRLLDELEELSMESEVVFVDDGSTDATPQVLDRLAIEHPEIRVVRLRRNFGKAAALRAGFDRAEGELIVTMDGDLQDDPSEIPRLLAKLEEGFDVVSGWKEQRADPWHKTVPSRFFNYLTSKLSGLHLRDHNSGFKVYRREVVEHLDLVGEMHRFLTVMAYWEGFAVTEIPVRHHPRMAGESKYGSGRLVKGSFDLLTALLTTRYSFRPLHLFGSAGAVFAVAGIGILAYLTVLWLLGRGPIGTRPLLFLGLLLTMVGVQLVSTGLMAELIVRQPLSREKASREYFEPSRYEVH